MNTFKASRIFILIFILIKNNRLPNNLKLSTLRILDYKVLVLKQFLKHLKTTHNKKVLIYINFFSCVTKCL